MKKQIKIGRFGSPFGIQGWVKVQSYTHPFDNILNYKPWYTDDNQVLSISSGKRHSKTIIVKPEGCNDRNQAQTYTHQDIYVDYSQLPELTGDEIYWTDLIGLQVNTVDGTQLGNIDHLFATGANDVMVVKGGKQHLIPYTKDAVIEVNLETGTVTVDWDPDF